MSMKPLKKNQILELKCLKLYERKLTWNTEPHFMMVGANDYTVVMSCAGL